MENFLNSNIPGSKNFFWKDALWLSKWKIYCIPTEPQETQIISICYKIEQVRSFLGKNISINSWLRPELYNALPEIGGSKNSAHIYGMAVDFTVEGMSCDDVRANLLTRLEPLKIRMEDRSGSNWVHIDNRDPGPKGNRFFRP